ncbi:MAG: Wzz/FepE/Etk N-terminal domain-containing protein [Hyphomicrobium sp.]
MQRAVDQFEEQEEGGGALSLDRALSAVRKRLKLVAVMPVVAAMIVAAVVMTMANRYDASAIVQIDPRQKSITNLDTVVSDLKGDQSTVESEVEIVRSRPIILKVIETLDLRNDPEFNRPPFTTRVLAKLGLATWAPTIERAPQRPHDQIADILKIDEPGTSRPARDEVADAFIQKLKVIRVRNTLLIDIRFSASEAGKAARIANTIAEVYLKDQLDSKTRAASTATTLLEEKLDEMRKKVSDAERRVEQWKAEHNVFDTEGQILSEKQLARLMEQTVTARNATTEARAKFDQAQKLARNGDAGTAIVEVLQSHTVRLLKEQVANARRKAAELQTKYGPKHPEMLKVYAEVAQAESQVKSEIERLVANLKNEAEVAEERERQLAQSLTQLKEQQIVSKDTGVDLKELEREAATSKQLFEALLTRYKQTAETQGFQLPDVRIIEKADAPQFPASPKRKQLVLIAAVGGLVLGLALAVLLELMAPGITRQDDIERVFEVSHLSSVPSPSNSNGVLPPSKAVRIVVSEPSSLYADAIRGARRELDMRRVAGTPRIILVTSSIAGEGAELIASNLAHNYAMTGGRPLLIDGDMRLQPLTRQLAAQRQRGLLDQVVNREPVEAAILRDGVTGLHFLPAVGPNAVQASIPETLNSTALAEQLVGLKSRFDTIIISVPPLLPVIDGRILADYADQIVFVVAWQKTPKQLAKSALKTLGLNDRKVAGIVLNDVAPEALNETRGWPRGLLGGKLGSGHDGPAQYAA